MMFKTLTSRSSKTMQMFSSKQLRKMNFKAMIMIDIDDRSIFCDYLINM